MQYLYETHMHTSESSSCASASAVEQVRTYKDRGYTGIVVTDHFIHGNSMKSWEKRIRKFLKGYETAKAEGDRIGLDVFLGWEYNYFGTHILTYGLGIDFLLANPDMCRLNIKKYCALITANGGYLSQAHTFRKWGIFRKAPVNPAYIDGVEVYNVKMSDRNNAMAVEYARQHNLPIQAGSDSHKPNRPFYSGIKLANRANSIFDI